VLLGHRDRFLRQRPTDPGPPMQRMHHKLRRSAHHLVRGVHMRIARDGTAVESQQVYGRKVAAAS
jgi:hypothetical protein